MCLPLLHASGLAVGAGAGQKLVRPSLARHLLQVTKLMGTSQLALFIVSNSGFAPKCLAPWNPVKAGSLMAEAGMPSVPSLSLLPASCPVTLSSSVLRVLQRPFLGFQISLWAPWLAHFSPPSPSHVCPLLRISASPHLHKLRLPLLTAAVFLQGTSGFPGTTLGLNLDQCISGRHVFTQHKLFGEI